MALINRFPDQQDELNYLRTERTIRLKNLRTGYILLAVAAIGTIILAPSFANEQARIAHSISAVALLVISAICYYFSNTQYYLEHRRYDILGIGSTSAAITVLTIAWTYAEAAPPDQLANTAPVLLGLLLWSTAIFWVANVKGYLTLALVMVTIFVSYGATLDYPILQKLQVWFVAMTMLAMGFVSNWEMDNRAREIFIGQQKLDAEREKTETLLYNVLPQTVAKRLRAGEVVADSFSDISIIFIDVIGFSKLSKQLSPGHLVEQLNGFFLIADECADRYGIEKVKTIGDCYLAVSGGTASGGHGAKDAVDFAKDVIAAMQDRVKDSGVDIKLRCGIHSGPVVGGVVGVNRLAYDYWGDTMNIASRIEGAALPNGIAVSETTYFQCATSHEFGPPETIALKGVGEMQIYRLKPEPA